MKKEKQVKSYQRRTKSGKMVTVRAHTAKYEAADKSKEVAKKKGAGKELEERKKKPVQMEIPFGKEEEKKVLDEVKETAEKKTAKKVRPVGSGTNGPTPKRKSQAKVTKTTASKPATSEPAFTAAEFKEWYRGTGSAADKKVAKALRAQLGRSGYRKLEDEAIDNYSSRGHLKLFKQISSEQQSKEKGTKRKLTSRSSGTTKVSSSAEITSSLRTESPSQTDKRIRDSIKGYDDLKKAGWKSVSRKNSAPRAKGPMRYLVSPDGTQEVQYRIVEPKNKWEPKGYVLMGKPSKVETSSKSSTGTSVKKVTTKKTKSPDLSTHEGQMSYIKSRVKELPEESRKRLNTFLRRASTGVISTTDLWRKYQREKYPKNKRQWSMPVPWDKMAWSDMAHSD